MKGCGIEFPHFGAGYPDARCCDGYLWDMDSWDESLGGMTIGGDDPCPVCNTEEWLKGVVGEDCVFETKEDALDYVKHLKDKIAYETDRQSHFSSGDKQSFEFL